MKKGSRTDREGRDGIDSNGGRKEGRIRGRKAL